jgi:prephenate dehydrogenase
MVNKIVSVYGYGRFGKLWTDILAENFKVKVFSRRGLDPAEVGPGVEVTDERGIFDCDAIFFCVAISSFAEVLEKARPYCKKKTVFFDTCSVKVLPVNWMKEHLPQGSKIIGTHPMFGPDSYPQTAKKLAMAMCNVSTGASEFTGWVEYFAAKSLRIELMTPDMHDEMAAYSQGITHYVGRLLADLKLHDTPIDTHGYQLLLNVMEQTCNDSWQLFLDLQNYNPYANHMRKDLDESIRRINDFLSEK